MQVHSAPEHQPAQCSVLQKHSHFLMMNYFYAFYQQHFAVYCFLNYCVKKVGKVCFILHLKSKRCFSFSKKINDLLCFYFVIYGNQTFYKKHTIVSKDGVFSFVYYDCVDYSTKGLAILILSVSVLVIPLCFSQWLFLKLFLLRIAV